MRLRPKLLLPSALALLFAPTLIMAQQDPGDCAGDADCPDGTYCLQVEEEYCTSAPCAEGDEECITNPAAPECEVQVTGICMPDWLVECQTDVDCDPGLVCTTFEEESCQGGDVVEPCEDPYACPPPEDTGECTVESYSFCLPPYLAPCELDVDCGEGFECRLEESCSCVDQDPAGGEGDPSGGGNEPSPDCTCETGDTGWCEVLVQPCDETVDCPDGWSCEANTYAEPSDVETCYVDDSGNEVCEPQPGDETCYVDDSGNEVCETQPADETETGGMTCIPPYWNDIPGGGSGAGDYPGEEVPDADPTLDDEEQAGDEDGANETPREDAPSVVGCSAGASGTGAAPAAMLLLFALVLGSRRRIRD